MSHPYRRDSIQRLRQIPLGVRIAREKEIKRRKEKEKENGKNRKAKEKVNRRLP